MITKIDDELNLFLFKTVSDVKANQVDVQRLLDGVRIKLNVDLVYILVSSGNNDTLDFTNVSFSDPRYNFKNTSIRVPLEDYNNMNKKFDDNNLGSENISHYFDFGRSLLQYGYVKANGIDGIIGFAEYTRDRAFTDDEKNALLKLAYVLRPYVLDKKDAQERAKRQSKDSMLKSRSNFLAYFNHNLRTALNDINGFANVAIQYPNKKDVKYNMDKLLSTSNELLGISANVIDYLLVDDDMITPTDKECSIIDLLKNSISSVDEKVKENKIFIDMGLDSLKLTNPIVYVDEFRMEQVLSNVLRSLIGYTNHNGTISIAVIQGVGKKAGIEKYEILIKNSCIGINKESVKKVFDLTDKYNGGEMVSADIRMIVAKRILEVLGGRMSVELEDRNTMLTTLVFNLKAKSVNTDLAKINKELKEKDRSSELKRKRVLLVDDNELNREIAEELLESYGLKVECCEDGVYAFDMIKKNNYDFILLDIQMPIMNGFDTTIKIRALEDETKRNIPIIAMTAESFDADRERGREVGMDAYVHKPFNVKEVLNIAAEILDERKGKKE